MAGDALEMATVKCALTEVDAIIQSLGVSVGPEIILKPTRFFFRSDASAGHRNGGGSTAKFGLLVCSPVSRRPSLPVQLDVTSGRFDIGRAKAATRPPISTLHSTASSRRSIGMA
jgi:hypothetical protein